MTALRQPAKAGYSARELRPGKNIENNPMQSKEPVEKRGVAGMDTYPAKNILTRRANQRHNFIIAQFARSPVS
jgi:hypothetical protein